MPDNPKNTNKLKEAKIALCDLLFKLNEYTMAKSEMEIFIALCNDRDIREHYKLDE